MRDTIHNVLYCEIIMIHSKAKRTALQAEQAVGQPHSPVY